MAILKNGVIVSHEIFGEMDEIFPRHNIETFPEMLKTRSNIKVK
jgi:hypothetical protein